MALEGRQAERWMISWRLRLGLVLLLTILCSRQAACQLPQFGQMYSGDGTYYGDTTPPGSGHCSFQFANSYPLPWTSGVNVPVAINAPQYLDSSPCGLCVQYRGVGTGSGADPIQTSEWRFAIVSDECPECLSGSLDLAKGGDGRWQIEWIPVQCNVGTYPFMYSFQGSNSYYIKLMIANTRVPVQSVTLDGNPMKKLIDNYWLATNTEGAGFSFPLSLSITSILGDTVTDTLPAFGFPDGSGTGTAQFPISCSYASVQPGGTLPLSGTPTATSNATDCPAPGSPPSSPSPPSNPTPATPVAVSPPPAAVSSPPPAAVSSPPPAAVSSPPPAAVSSPPPAAAVSSPPPAAAVSSPPPAVNSSPPPAAAISRPPPAVIPSPPPAANPNPPPSAATRPSPPASPPSAQMPTLGNASTTECDRTIPKDSQCGGRGGQCAIQTAELNPSNCVDAVWNNTCCAAGSYCQRFQQFIWQCSAMNATTDRFAVTNGSVIPALKQCGGTGTCPEDKCADAQWSTISCTNGTTCSRWDEHYWQCRTAPFSRPVVLLSPLTLPESPLAG